ncbi:hypothetical protein COCNU_10G001400 [Cocos nucifera]|uniref:Uncharacterized protein n=1 Tax=Cocos nucifera TaxID=13894 RepID=A0A8K0IL98_COCNU|nr:hypothetical protein COCNU_10G001400 [Cocos nucifera]
MGPNSKAMRFSIYAALCFFPTPHPPLFFELRSPYQMASEDLIADNDGKDDDRGVEEEGIASNPRGNGGVGEAQGQEWLLGTSRIMRMPMPERAGLQEGHQILRWKEVGDIGADVDVDEWHLLFHPQEFQLDGRLGAAQIRKLDDGRGFVLSILFPFLFEQCV